MFCGGPGLTKQHLWAARLRDLVPTVENKTTLFGLHPTHMTLNGQHVVVIQTHLRERARGNVATWQMRCVCKTCNGGWIKRVEDAAFPALKAMILGLPRVIEPAEQRAVATWAGIVATMNERRFPPDQTTVPTADRRYMWEHEELPPQTWRVWTGFYSGVRWSWRIQHHPGAAIRKADLVGVDVLNTKNMQHSVLVVGRMLVQVTSLPFPEAERAYRGRSAQGLYRIWPAPTVGRLWPPGVVLDDADADFFGQMYHSTEPLPPIPGAL